MQSIRPKPARELLQQAEKLWGGEPLAGINGEWAGRIRRALTERSDSLAWNRAAWQAL